MIERIALLCNPDNRRAHFFTQACAALRLPTPILIAYTDWLSGRCPLDEMLSPTTLLRIESPGESLVTQRLLLERGAAHPDATCPARHARDWQPAHGQIIHAAQRFYGWRDALLGLQDTVTRSACHVMTSPSDIIDMFDKHNTYNRLSSHEIRVPARLPAPTSYDSLRAIMHEQRCANVFLKPRFGSSASGVVALRVSDHKIQATTSTQMVGSGHDLELFNALRIQRYDRETEVAMLIDALTRSPVVLERWVPKATLDSQSVDMRIVVSQGKATHVLGRRSASPMTNLHLGNARVLLPGLIAEFGEQAIRGARDLAARAMRLAFPESGYAGLDVMLTSGSLTPQVIEVNAFGDLLPNLLVDGEDTYTSALRRTITHIKNTSSSKG